MSYLLDSDWTIDYLLGVPGAMRLMERLSGDGAAISIITHIEVYQGTRRSANREAAQAKLDAFLFEVPILSLSMAIAQRCADLRETLSSQRRRVGQRAFDLIIAATALEHDLILVTRNVRDYADIPDLKLYGPLYETRSADA